MVTNIKGKIAVVLFWWAALGFIGATLFYSMTFYDYAIQFIVAALMALPYLVYKHRQGKREGLAGDSTTSEKRRLNDVPGNPNE